MTTYVEDSEGKFIPASQRPDGTWRKARRVKDGYVPQEEVPLYESKGKLYAKKPFPVGMCPMVAEKAKEKRTNQKQTYSGTSKSETQNQRIPGIIHTKNLNDVSTSSSSKINKIHKALVHNVSTPQIKTSCEINENLNHVSMKLDEICLDSEVELAKKLKKLKKKIREIEQIQIKLNSGELKNPEKDQLDKVARKDMILKEIDELEKQSHSP